MAEEGKPMTEPWKYSVCDDGHMIVHTEGDVICHSDPNHAPGDCFDADNFRLIAAAPDLLHELQEVLEWALVEKAPLREQEIQSIRAAIDKAKG